MKSIWFYYGFVASVHHHDDVRIIKTEDRLLHLSVAEVSNLIEERIGFLDITRHGIPRSDFTPDAANLPTQLNWERGSSVKEQLDQISLAMVYESLKEFTSFRNRYYRSEYGVAAAEWLFDRMNEITSTSKYRIILERVHHTEWPQFSIICRLEDPQYDFAPEQERIVLSAHLDSISPIAPMTDEAPGADDDGSGVVTVLEVLRLVSAATLNLNRPIDFVFYSAEEVGLLGSQEIVRYYQIEGISAAVLHIDMDGYTNVTNSPSLGIIEDHTDSRLNEIIMQLAKRYTSLPVKRTKCGYACSDHATWTLAGYRAAALFEGGFEDQSPRIHTKHDTIEFVNFNHLKEFIKVALAYVLHMTDPLNVYE